MKNIATGQTIRLGNAGNIRYEFYGSNHRLVSHMVVGEVGYVTSWSVKNRHIDPGAMVSHQPGGTVDTKVVCVGDGLYDVDHNSEYF